MEVLRSSYESTLLIYYSLTQQARTTSGSLVPQDTARAHAPLCLQPSSYFSWMRGATLDFLIGYFHCSTVCNFRSFFVPSSEPALENIGVESFGYLFSGTAEEKPMRQSVKHDSFD